MNATILLLISLVTTITLSAWRSGLIQSVVNRWALRLPRWAQPIPPIALSVLATVAVWLVQGPSDAALVEALADGGVSGALAVGLYHVAKRWTPAGIVGKVRAAAKGGAVLIVLLVGCTGTQKPVSAADGIAVADAAIGATGAALAATIDALPPGEDLGPWSKRVAVVTEAAEDVAKAGATVDDACRALDSTSTIAEQIDCKECLVAIDKISGVLCGGVK